MDTFEFDYEGQKIMVSKHLVSNQTIYRAIFANGRHPLVLTRATKGSGTRFWTSIPQGRLKEAEDIGELIEGQLKLNF